MIINLLLIVGVAIAIGPLLGVVADRAVDRVRPELELRCASCQHGMGRKSLVPVLHLFQRCEQCGASVGSRYIAVDMLTVLVFVALGLRFGLSIKLLPYLILGATLVVLSVVDAETHLLPNVIVWPSIWLATPLTLILSQVIDGSRFVPALVGGLAFGGFIGASHVAYSAGMGRGDVKLALLLGVYVGWASADSLGAIRLVLYSVVLALLGGALVGMAYNAIMKRGRAEIPFGPALAAASLVIIVSSPAILDGIAS